MPELPDGFNVLGFELGIVLGVADGVFGAVSGVGLGVLGVTSGVAPGSVCMVEELGLVGDAPGVAVPEVPGVVVWGIVLCELGLLDRPDIPVPLPAEPAPDWAKAPAAAQQNCTY